MNQTDSQDHDHRHLDQDLRTLRIYLPDLRLLAAKKASVTAHSSHAGLRTTAPIPLNEGAWNLLEDIEHFAWSLGRAVGVRQRHVPTEGLLTAATNRVDRLLARPDAPIIKRMAATLVQRMGRQFEPPEDHTLIGYCQQCGSELWCVDEDIAGGWTVCPSCHATLKVRDIQQARILRLAASGAQGTAASLCSLLQACGVKVKRNTVTQWRKRGIIHPVAQEDGKPVYLLWDVWQAVNRGTVTDI